MQTMHRDQTYSERVPPALPGGPDLAGDPASGPGERPDVEPTAVRGPIACAIATVGLVAGLLIDQWYHSRTPARHETGLFDLSNPGHVVFGLSLALLIGATWLALVDTRNPVRRSSGVIAIAITVLFAAVAGGVAFAQRAAAAEATGGADESAAAHPSHPDEPVGGSAAAPSSNAPAGGGHEHGPAPATGPSQNQLDLIKQSIAKYQDLAAAKADGYQLLVHELPGMGAHYVSPTRSMTSSFDMTKPSFLLYTHSGGSSQLMAAGYSLSKSAYPQPPTDLQGAHWHSHQWLCFTTGGGVAMTSQSDCRAKNGYWIEDTGWLVHAWVYRDNPSGVFEELNPTV